MTCLSSRTKWSLYVSVAGNGKVKQAVGYNYNHAESVTSVVHVKMYFSFNFQFLYWATLEISLDGFTKDSAKHCKDAVWSGLAKQVQQA